MAKPIGRRKELEKVGEGRNPGHLTFNDFYNRPESISATIASLVERGSLVKGRNGKLTVNVKPTASVSPWFYIRKSADKQCETWHDLYFDHFDFVHSGCRKCWKVGLLTHHDPKYQTVKDLFKLRDLLLRLNMASKCGVDVRLFTPARYLGFIYNDSLEQGRLCYDTVKPILLDMFPKGDIFLKLGCTEFEHTFGPTNQWAEHIPGWKALEQYMDYIVEPADTSPLYGLMEATEADTLRFWIEYAHCIGDSTWKDALRYQGYKPPENLFFKCITYHEEE
jgi:hypothetical protein